MSMYEYNARNLAFLADRYSLVLIRNLTLYSHLFDQCVVCVYLSPGLRIVNETTTETRLAPGSCSLTPALFLVLFLITLTTAAF
jgi:hypothetical protein